MLLSVTVACEHTSSLSLSLSLSLSRRFVTAVGARASSVLLFVCDGPLSCKGVIGAASLALKDLLHLPESGVVQHFALTAQAPLPLKPTRLSPRESDARLDVGARE